MTGGRRTTSLNFQALVDSAAASLSLSNQLARIYRRSAGCMVKGEPRTKVLLALVVGRFSRQLPLWSSGTILALGLSNSKRSRVRTSAEAFLLFLLLQGGDGLIII